MMIKGRVKSEWKMEVLDCRLLIADWRGMGSPSSLHIEQRAFGSKRVGVIWELGVG